MVKRRYSVIVILLFFALLFCGCQQQSQSNTKKDRLVGNENIRLKKELEKQAGLLEQCQQEKKQLADDSDKMAEFLMELHSEAVKENEVLKSRIAELESQAGSPR
ncbi:MAG: hypothetical protein GWO86_02105 [Planctomycetes bacterium]|nr:hypothetical protein [Planctomycetota bacterium]